MATLADIVIDCRHPASLARFWSEALDDYVIAPYDDAEIARLAAAGVFAIEDDPTVVLLPTVSGPRIWLQRVGESKLTKNRVHLDLRARDLYAEVARLCAVGAAVIAENPQNNLVVMSDPEGNEFCVVEDSDHPPPK